MSNADNETRKIRDYVSDRMSNELPPDFVGGVMREVQHTPQRRGWAGWPMVAGLATMAGAAALVGVGLSFLGDGGGTGAGGTASPSPSVASSPRETDAGPQTAAPSAGPAIWDMDPEAAFTSPQSCENLAGAPTLEEGENAAWRIWLPGDWYTTESYLGECMWFGPTAWDPTLEPTVPDEVAIVIHVLNQEVTPGQTDYAGGDVVTAEEFIVDGAPAIRYELEGSGGRVLGDQSVVWVIGIHGELPSPDDVATPFFLTLTTSSDEAGRLAQQAEVLDRMVATLKILEG